ncbi:MAG TPA: hypothetical protein VM939_00430, partial [Gemmatimonadaceae bacterium]|nr:hypothetical protein [Gemmatimonadaceae bacterium]
MPKNFAIGAALALSIINTSACIPLTVGSTANPVPVGTSVRNMSTYVVPRSFEDSTSDYSLPRYGVDGETRFGFDAHSDIGIRV